MDDVILLHEIQSMIGAAVDAHARPTPSPKWSAYLPKDERSALAARILAVVRQADQGMEAEAERAAHDRAVAAGTMVTGTVNLSGIMVSSGAEIDFKDVRPVGEPLSTGDKRSPREWSTILAGMVDSVVPRRAAMGEPVLTLEPSHYGGVKFVGHDSVFGHEFTRTISFESATRATIVFKDGAVKWVALEDGKVTIVDATKPETIQGIEVVESPAVPPDVMAFLDPLGRSAVRSMIVNASRVPLEGVTVPKIETTLKGNRIMVTFGGEEIGYVRLSTIRKGRWVVKNMEDGLIAEADTDQEAVDKLVEDHVRRQRSGKA